MLETIKRFIAQARRTEATKRYEAEVDYAELLSHVAAGEEDAELAPAACLLLEEMGRSIDDLESDARTYARRKSYVEKVHRLTDLRAATNQARKNRDAARAKLQDAVAALQAEHVKAVNEYEAALDQVRDAEQASEALGTTLPSWMTAERDRLNRLDRSQTHDEVALLPESDKPHVRRAELFELAGRAIVWPLPSDLDAQS